MRGISKVLLEACKRENKAIKLDSIRVEVCWSWATMGWSLGWYSKAPSALRIRVYKVFCFLPTQFPPGEAHNNDSVQNRILLDALAIFFYFQPQNLGLSASFPFAILDVQWCILIRDKNSTSLYLFFFILPFVRAMKCWRSWEHQHLGSGSCPCSHPREFPFQGKCRC